MLLAVLNLFKGRCTYDVHTKGGGGVEPKEDVVREVEWILYCKSEQKGGGAQWLYEARTWHWGSEGCWKVRIYECRANQPRNLLFWHQIYAMGLISNSLLLTTRIFQGSLQRVKSHVLSNHAVFSILSCFPRYTSQSLDNQAIWVNKGFTSAKLSKKSISGVHFALWHLRNPKKWGRRWFLNSNCSHFFTFSYK